MVGTKLLITTSLSLGTLLAFSAIAKESYVPNQILIKTNSSAKQSVNKLNSMALQSGALNSLGKISQNLSVLRYSTALSAKEAAAELSRLPGIEWAQPNYIYTVPKLSSPVKSFKLPSSIFDFVPYNEMALNDPLLTPEGVWGMFKIEATEAWKLSKGTEQVLVADIDTGVDYTHEDLKANIWTNPDTSAADQHSYDFANKDADPMDDHSHGTHTTGSIGARGNNSIGLAGVSPYLKVIAIKFISGEGSGTTADAILSIDYAVAKGARILSNSWGGPAEGDESDKALEEAIIRAGQKDVLFVAAAGNDGTNNDSVPMFPAAYSAENILSVASSNSSDNLSFFSNYGIKTVDVAAPGSNINSTVPGNKYLKNSGTSMACPHVAGLAALLLSINSKLSAAQLKSIIMETVDPISSMSAKVVSGGRINALKAVKRAQEFGL